MRAAASEAAGGIGLRARLTLSYAVAFVLLVLGVGLVFRSTLRSILHDNIRAILEEDWGAVRGYLQIDRNRPIWFYDREDSEEAFFIRRLRRIFLLADAQGNVLEVSELYAQTGLENAEELRRMLREKGPMWRERKGPNGETYLLRTGVLVEDRKEYLLTIGRSRRDADLIIERATRTYYTITPLLILAFSGLGWVIAGRALKPITDVARTAQMVTGENLGLRIPPRNAGDELDDLIASFNGMVDRLEESFTQIRQFTVDASHELRTPLTTIRGELEVALLTARNEEQYREAILLAIDEVDRLAKVVRALLQLSQAESGQVALAEERVDLSAVAHEVAERFEPQAELSRQRLEVEAPRPVFASGDRLQLDRLVSNLVTNAIKYTPEGGRITVGVVEADGMAQLVVSDNGRGIAKEHLPHLFERFYRVPDGNADAEKGLGLGLSFVAWIVRAHRGTIDVESEPGRGTSFRVRLPLAQAALSEETPRQEEARR
jgi:heavy metal sensor kinase